MDKNKVDIIEQLKQKMLANPDRPYREGAWEGYLAKEGLARKTPVHKLWIPWVAAAVALAVGFVFFQDREVLQIVQQDPVQKQPNKAVVGSDLPPEQQTLAGKELLGNPSTNVSLADQNRFNTAIAPTAVDLLEIQGPATSRQAIYLASANAGEQRSASPTRIELDPVANLSVASINFKAFKPLVDDSNTYIPGLGSIAYVPEPTSSPTKPASGGNHLLDKFEIGAFFSPNTTDKNMNFGGGLVVAYQLSDKLSVRTGASMNAYDVGMNTEPQMMASSVSDLSSNYQHFSARNGETMANVNAISGTVQTLDIPIEVKYTVVKNFYVSGGVSYAAVLSQKRFNHVVNNANSMTFENGISNSNISVARAVASVSDKIEINENNLDPNGLGGFVNFSIGRKVPLSKSIKLSVEPYIKLPIGQFKQADMDYTNGGLRIMTSF